MKFSSKTASSNKPHSRSVFTIKSVLILGIMIIFSCLQNYECKNLGKFNSIINLSFQNFNSKKCFFGFK